MSAKVSPMQNPITAMTLSWIQRPPLPITFPPFPFALQSMCRTGHDIALTSYSSVLQCNSDTKFPTSWRTAMQSSCILHDSCAPLQDSQQLRLGLDAENRVREDLLSIRATESIVESNRQSAPEDTFWIPAFSQGGIDCTNRARNAFFGDGLLSKFHFDGLIHVA